ncbi:protoporphyrinogen oxidase [Corynebacterium anserum]|uniref:Coproporphyrinogen III oxidase n=1 Tax=Corynebacterium anserum TaxID=2684406 RepID=A0A7G7YNM2_9CORY|nr:protoporphyrinogen oxidase [Corynebacterium anserum]MBC2681673.1 protoporphyrinogen oxidase [Corynebacterium anserum]QNH96092.1 protoporphyrinogen oxidase [Corynebacterium anserum]
MTPQFSGDDRPVKIAVIGGGIAGVSAAWKLRKLLGERANILIAEAYDRIGGKLKTVNFAYGPVDMGAEAFMGMRQDFVEIIKDVGLESELRTPSGLPSGLFIDGQLVDIPRATIMGIPADGSTVEHIVGSKAAQRINAERDGVPMTWAPGQDASVGQLVEARLGSAVVHRLVSPMLGGVYSSSAYDLGVRATLPQLASELDRRGADGGGFFLTDVVSDLLAERQQRSASGGGSPAPTFYSLACGYRGVVNALAQQADAEVLYNTGVEAIGRSSKGWYIEPIGDVDAVVIATPAPTASVLLQDMAVKASEALSSIELASSVVVGMRFASDVGIPQRSGVLLGSDAPTEAKAFTFSSRKWPHLAERGGAFVRASFGTLREPWYVEADDLALLAYAIDDLQTLTGERKKPEEFFVQRWWGGIPCYGPGYQDIVNAAYEEVRDIKGLALAGSMLNGVGVPSAAATGIAAAEEIVSEMGWG